MIGSWICRSQKSQKCRFFLFCQRHWGRWNADIFKICPPPFKGRICRCPCERTINPHILKALCFEDQAARLCLGTYPDLDLERDLDSERFEAREGLPDPDRLSDLMLAGLPRSDLDGERDSWSHTRMLKQLTVNMAPDNKKQVFCFVNILLLQCICKCCGERC